MALCQESKNRMALMQLFYKISGFNRCFAKLIVLHDCVIINDKNVVHYVLNSVNKCFRWLSAVIVFFQEGHYISKAHYFME